MKPNRITVLRENSIRSDPRQSEYTLRTGSTRREIDQYAYREPSKLRYYVTLLYISPLLYIKFVIPEISRDKKCRSGIYCNRRECRSGIYCNRREIIRREKINAGVQDMQKRKGKKSTINLARKENSNTYDGFFFMPKRRVLQLKILLMGFEGFSCAFTCENSF